MIDQAAWAERSGESEMDDTGSTGNQAVDAAVRAVQNASGLPAAEQFAAYEAAHRTLREVLASIDE